MSADHRQFESVDLASSLETDDSRALIQQAQNGCDDALGTLIRSLQGYLLLIANEEVNAELRAKVSASDLVQNALLRAQQSLPEFRGSSRQTLLAWLRKILVREILTARRRYLDCERRDVHREATIAADGLLQNSFADSQPTPHSDAVLAEEARRLRAAVESLPADYRSVVVLRNWQQLPFEEVGRQMHRSADAAKKLWSRAIGQLERELRDDL